MKKVGVSAETTRRTAIARTGDNATFAFTAASIRRRFAPIQSSQVWTNPTTTST